MGKWAIKEQQYGQHFNAIMFRRTTVSAEDAIERSHEIYGPLGGKFNSTNLVWRMPRGGRVSFKYLERVRDADHYQGRNVTDAWVEEAGQYADATPIDRLNGVLRSAQGVPTQLILTANPGGPGQFWLRERYRLLPLPTKPKVILRTLPNGKIHRVAVIPSRIFDNKVMLHADPGYINRLYLSGNEKLVKAWLEGDWGAVEGAFFDIWSDTVHVIEPFEIPEHWLRFRSGDWGSARPFSFGWWAVVSDPHRLDSGQTLPRGAMVRYREWYGVKSLPSGELEPNHGLKLTAEEVGQGLWQREKNDPKLAYGVLDPSAFTADGGPSIAENIYNGALAEAKEHNSNRKITFRRADNRRVGKKGALGGWDQMRARLKGDENPMIYCFSTCENSIRTIPVLPHDEVNIEDIDTDTEDHAADDWRYACMSRPYIKQKPKETEPVKGIESMTINDLWEREKWRARR